jgi:hypothetical protein
MTSWQKPTRQPPKTKAELREMLTEAVRNTQPSRSVRRRPKEIAARVDLPTPLVETNPVGYSQQRMCHDGPVPGEPRRLSAQEGGPVDIGGLKEGAPTLRNGAAGVFDGLGL